MLLVGSMTIQSSCCCARRRAIEKPPLRERKDAWFWLKRSRRGVLPRKLLVFSHRGANCEQINGLWKSILPTLAWLVHTRILAIQTRLSSTTKRESQFLSPFKVNKAPKISRSAFLLEPYIHIETFCGCCSMFIRVLKNNEYLHESFAYNERMKARVFLEMLAGSQKTRTNKSVRV